MIADHQAQVREFHIATGLPNPETPRIPDEIIARLRCNLLVEEVQELMLALEDRYYIGGSELQLVHIADSIADILYVAYGAAVTFGIDIHPVFNAVQRANMRKVGGPVREDGKRLKPPGWIGPEEEIKIILKHQSGVIEQFDGVVYEGPMD